MQSFAASLSLSCSPSLVDTLAALKKKDIEGDDGLQYILHSRHTREQSGVVHRQQNHRNMQVQPWLRHSVDAFT